MATKMTHYQIKEPVFNSGCTLVANCTIEDLSDWVRANINPDAPPFDPNQEKGTDGISFTRENKDGKLYRIVWIRTFTGEVFVHALNFKESGHTRHH